MAKIVIGKGFTLEEREIFRKMLFYQKKALAFNFTYRGKVKLEVLPPQIIETIKHKAWQSPGFPVPKALLFTIIEII